MSTLIDLILQAGAIAWITTALVYKEGPFGLLAFIRKLVARTYTYLRWNPAKSPLNCAFCTGFWVGLIILSAFTTGDELMRAAIQFFGVLGIASALRGASVEFG